MQRASRTISRTVWSHATGDLLSSPDWNSSSKPPCQQTSHERVCSSQGDQMSPCTRVSMTHFAAALGAKLGGWLVYSLALSQHTTPCAGGAMPTENRTRWGPRTCVKTVFPALLCLFFSHCLFSHSNRRAEAYSVLSSTSTSSNSSSSGTITRAAAMHWVFTSAQCCVNSGEVSTSLTGEMGLSPQCLSEGAIQLGPEETGIY